MERITIAQSEFKPVSDQIAFIQKLGSQQASDFPHPVDLSKFSICRSDRKMLYAVYRLLNALHALSYRPFRPDLLGRTNTDLILKLTRCQLLTVDEAVDISKQEPRAISACESLISSMLHRLVTPLPPMQNKLGADMQALRKLIADIHKTSYLYPPDSYESTVSLIVHT